MTEPAQPSGRFSLRALGPLAALLSSAAVVGQVFGLGRELYIANQVGASSRLDALLVAAVFPALLGGVLSSATSTAMVPAYVALTRAEGEDAARRLAGTLLGWIGLMSLVVTVLLILMAAPLVRLSGPGLSNEASALAAGFIPLLAPITVLSAMMGLLSAICQIHDRFRPISLAWLSGPLVSFVATVALWGSIGIHAVAVGMSLAAGLPAAIVLIYTLRARLLPPISLRVDRRLMGDFLRHAFPLSASAVIGQFNVLADRAVASVLPAGSVSTLRYGEVVIRSPSQAVVPAWTTVAFPALVRASHADDQDALGAAVNRSLRYIFAVFVPLTVATVALAPLVVELVYLRGAFDLEAARATALVVAAFAPVLVILMVHSVFVGTLNAHRKGVVLLANGSARLVLNAALNLALGALLGVAGIALSTSVTSLVLLMWLGWNVRRLEPTFAARPILGMGTRVLIASLIPGIPIALLAWSMAPVGSVLLALGLLVGFSAVGAIGYVVGAWVMGVVETGTILRAVRTKALSRLPGSR